MTTYRPRRLNAYALVRGAIALVLLVAVFAAIAVPVYLALQVALAFLGIDA